MMQSLIGQLPATSMDIVQAKTKFRFKDSKQFVTPEALIIYEQQLIDEEKLFDACQREYNLVLDECESHYVPVDIIEKFRGQNVVLLDYVVADRTIYLATIPEFYNSVKNLHSDTYKLELSMITLYKYIEIYTKQYGQPEFLTTLPIRDKWDFIVQEAIQLGASDITLTNTQTGALVYYNARKTKVLSKRSLEHDDVDAIIKLLAGTANSTMADNSARPRFFSIDINRQNRGRVVVNRTLHGLLMTIRVLPNTVLNKTLEELNVAPNTCEFIRNVMLSQEKGLRLFIGETMSGKNTTILCALNELVNKGTMKIVSLEQPVEIMCAGIEQINAETDEEFALNADSLLRQNPDIIYFTEITERTSTAIMKQANTAKAVFSTIHANSIADVLFRLQDITGMSLDRILLTLHSCVYQELVRDPKRDIIIPYNRCLYFSDAVKTELFGKSIAEVRGRIAGMERRWGT